ncbi:MAG: SAM-dependent chlorinase/fluorinase [Flavobacteriales bacterium]|nr:SAM-dependent chlorinase/fluorinase [Flavobacteriales bacterium]
MPIITLLTDLGTSDWYAGTLKGALMSLIPGVQLVDITHQIPKYDTARAGFVLRNSYAWFPKGTIHLISVDSTFHFEKPFVAVKFDGHYFIGTDNGIFSLAFGQETLQGLVDLSNVEPDVQASLFPARDVFARAADMILKGAPFESLGKPVHKLFPMFDFQPVYGEMGIQGHVLYTDEFGNVITNILKSNFEKHVGNRSFLIRMRRERYSIQRISRSYNSVAMGDACALFNSSGFLEVALNNGSASRLLGLNRGDIINVLFNDPQNSQT